jgi:hypothetical protein
MSMNRAGNRRKGSETEQTRRNGTTEKAHKLFPCILDGRHIPNGAKPITNTMEIGMSSNTMDIGMASKHAHKAGIIEMSTHRKGRMKDFRTIPGVLFEAGENAY